jgi:cytochrome c
MNTTKTVLALLLACTTLIAACGGGDESEAPDAGAAQAGGLTQEQLEKGIGPAESVSLGAIDEALAERGEEIFTMKCTACHKLDERYVGPPLNDVLDRRTPEYVMNMMLNPAEMLEKHPEAKAMLAQYLTPMPNQSLTEDDARAVLEYLRTAQEAAAEEAAGEAAQ